MERLAEQLASNSAMEQRCLRDSRDDTSEAGDERRHNAVALALASASHEEHKLSLRTPPRRRE